MGLFNRFRQPELTQPEPEAVVARGNQYVVDMPYNRMMSYDRFRLAYPISQILFEEPLFLSIESGVFWHNKKINQAHQRTLIRGGFERVLKQAYIQALNGQDVYIAEVDGIYEIRNKNNLENYKYSFLPSQSIPQETKNLIMHHHHLLTDVGIPMGYQSSKTILGFKQEQGLSKINKDEMEDLQNSLNSYDSAQVLVAAGEASFETIQSPIENLLSIRRVVLSSISMATNIPIEILDRSTTARALFSSGDSDDLKRYKSLVANLAQDILYPIYDDLLPDGWAMVDPFTLGAETQLSLQQKEQEILKAKIENYKALTEMGITIENLNKIFN